MEFNNLSTYVVETIKKKIYSGELMQGQHINVSSIAQELGLSKAPVREAINQMAANNGLIEIKPRRGAFVISFKKEDAYDHYALRAALESYATRSLAGLPQEKVERICRCFDTETISFTEQENGHLEIIKATNNKLLLNTYLSLYDRAALLGSMTARAPERKVQALEEHREIKKLLEQGDFFRASMVIERHIIQLADVYINYMGLE